MLTHWVRDRGILTLEEAISHLTSRPADAFGLVDRGRLQPGLAADVVIFNHALSPAQERNLEQLCHCRVLDRTGLILDIFAQRARTHEGKLQVEVAQLNYSLPRLHQKQTGLSRLTGGIGGRGPGETKLEVKMDHKKLLTLFLMVSLERCRSIIGKAFHRRTKRLK